MPIDYKKYPADWKGVIRPDILERAGNSCEQCGVPNYEQGYRGLDGKFYDSALIWDELENNGYDYFQHELQHCYDKKGNPTLPIKIVLTISHQDHDLTNNDYSNLKALCQKCHLNHDKEHHKQSRKRNKGLQTLFP